MTQAAPSSTAPPAAEGWAEAAEARVLTSALPLAPRQGWGAALVKSAARAAGLSEADAALLLPNGARDLAALLFRRHDAQALTALAGVDPATLKVRERIARGVEARVEATAADAAAVRRATAFLARPGNLALGAGLLWASADAIWRWAGDTATDENHYTKRLLLSEILASTATVRLASGPASAAEHLARRIEGVMAFERWKAGALRPSALLDAAASALGRWRYGAAPKVEPVAGLLTDERATRQAAGPAG